jgi:hypothetical protein
VDSAPLSYRNVIINGNFDIWQRGTTNAQVSLDYLADRWVAVPNGSTRNYSQQVFSAGQTDVPGNPFYFARTVVTSVAGATNFVYFGQRIENVATFAGETVTLSFWAKADANKNIALEFVQNFGTGGSSGILNIGVTTFSLTSSWKKFTATVSIPSIAGKTIGANNYLGMQWWLDAGSNWNSRTNSLGQQSGTFDIAQVQLEVGSKASAFERRPYSLELSLAQRYCFDAFGSSKAGNYTKLGTGGMVRTATTSSVFLPLPVPMRVAPTSLDFSGNVVLVFGGTGISTPSSVSVDLATTSNTTVTFAVVHPSGPTVGAYAFIEANNTQTVKAVLSAEL